MGGGAPAHTQIDRPLRLIEGGSATSATLPGDGALAGRVGLRALQGDVDVAPVTMPCSSARPWSPPPIPSKRCKRCGVLLRSGQVPG